MDSRFGLTGNEPATSWFHLGSDLPARQVDAVTDAPRLADVNLGSRNQTILMVGTIEPRKGHTQMLDALDQLWQREVACTLVIAGRQGWRVESFIDRLNKHPQAGKRLLWFPDINDSQLAQLYAGLDGLVMASEAEGFGLPLIEAAQYGMPLFVRDLPVFREVAGEHASYFIANNGLELAPQLDEWLSKLISGTAPASQAIKSLTWSASAERLKGLIERFEVTSTRS
ncbi:glycosyltransferase [Paraburkholderia acidicola]|uniref:Glycosyltransferase n=2 Tax=Paraburkholderia acidicola TaxID=1912599 RepID=A0ABV1LVQ4_9BURK